MFEKLRKNYFLFVTILLIIYFLFNFLGGERGLLSYYKKQLLFTDLKNEELKIINNIENLNHKNLLLTDNIDLDFIEILIRKKFLFGKKNETIYIIKNNE